MFGLFSFMEYLMVVVLFLMMFVDIVSLGFEFFLLMVEKMKIMIFCYYENKLKKKLLSYEKDFYIVEM